MADEKEKKGTQEEVVGLDDETPQKKSLFDRLKKFILPASIGIGSMLIMIAVYVFVIGRDHPTGDEKQNVDSAEMDTDSDAKHETEHSSHYDYVIDVDESGEPTQRLVFVDTVNFEKDDKRAQKDEKNKIEAKKKTLKVDTVKLTREDLGVFEIDTAEIMKGLEFIFVTPEQERIKETMSPQDSVDTLNWIQKEMAKLDDKTAEFEKKKKELETLDYKVNQSLLKLGQAESSRIINLARLYDGMKPHEVGKLFANLSDEVVISILPRMKPANASKILALLPPKRAARISTSMITVLEDK